MRPLECGASATGPWSIEMSRADLFASTDTDQTQSLTCAQKEVLERAVAKIVLLGSEVGVSADQMILLLDSGLTVRELLEYLSAQGVESA
jgi:hypothetical protein